MNTHSSSWPRNRHPGCRPRCESIHASGAQARGTRLKAAHHLRLIVQNVEQPERDDDKAGQEPNGVGHRSRACRDACLQSAWRRARPAARRFEHRSWTTAIMTHYIPGCDLQHTGPGSAVGCDCPKHLRTAAAITGTTREKKMTTRPTSAMVTRIAAGRPARALRPRTSVEQFSAD